MEEGSVHCHWTNRILVSTALFDYQGTSTAKKLHRDKTQDKFLFPAMSDSVIMMSSFPVPYSRNPVSYHRIERLFLLLGDLKLLYLTNLVG